MHEALGQFSTATAQETSFVPESTIVSRSTALERQPAFQPSAYTGQKLRWPALVTVGAAHVALLAMLATLGVVHVSPPKRDPIVVNMIQLPDEPLPPPPLEAKSQPNKPTESPIVAPAPQVVLPPAPSPVQTVAVIPPVQQVVVATPSDMGPVSVAAEPIVSSDLMATRIAGKPASYPPESYRRKETGTVLLYILVGTDGDVERVSVLKSSGFDRLDKAAVAAARKWRWKPTIRNGTPVRQEGKWPVSFTLAS